MHLRPNLRVHDNRDISRQSVPSPSLCYSLTHVHRSIGYRNRNPQSLAESATRLMYLRVYDSRDSSCQSAPSPSPCYPLTHEYRSIGYRNRNPQTLAESVSRLMYLCVYEITLVSLYPPRPHTTRSHMYAGPLVIRPRSYV